ncbi:MAG: histidine kinase [Clostridiales bacterium]|nr:histidine kinase [Clostridiales bacterium]
MKFFRLRIFQKMVLSVLAVVATFFVVGLISNSYSKQKLSQAVDESFKMRSRFFVEQIDLHVEGLLASLLNLSSDSQLLDYYIMHNHLSPYEKTKTIKELSEKLTSMKRLHLLAQDLWIYFPLSQEKISSTLSIYHKGKELPLPTNRVSHDSEGNILLSVRYPYSNWDSQKKPAFFIQSKISSQFIELLFSDLLTEKESLFLVDTSAHFWSGSKVPSETERNVIYTGLENMKKIDGEGFFFRENDLAVALYPIDFLGLTLAFIPSPDEISLPLAPYQWLNILLFLLSALLLVIYSIYIAKSFMRPIDRLLSRMEEVPEEITGKKSQQIPKDEFSVIYQKYEDMIERNNRLISENYESSYRTRMAELRQLQYQIRPHFLYNSIFLIYRMAKSAYCDDIAEYAGHLGNYYQYITRFADHEVALEQEIDHINHYIDIQRTRFGERIEVLSSSMPTQAQGMMISALVLQPLVENAYEHGLRNKTSGGKLLIEMDWIENRFYFAVEDNGVGMSEQAMEQLRSEMENTELSEETRGLANTNLRLVMRYGKESRLNLSTPDYGGFRVSVSIPKEEGKNVQSSNC